MAIYEFRCEQCAAEFEELVAVGTPVASRLNAQLRQNTRAHFGGRQRARARDSGGRQ
jgi:hypothetical protein